MLDNLKKKSLAYRCVAVICYCCVLLSGSDAGWPVKLDFDVVFESTEEKIIDENRYLFSKDSFELGIKNVTIHGLNNVVLKIYINNRFNDCEMKNYPCPTLVVYRGVDFLRHVIVIAREPISIQNDPSPYFQKNVSHLELPGFSGKTVIKILDDQIVVSAE